MRIGIFIFPAILCPLALYCSSTAQPYSIEANIAWRLTWISGVSLLFAVSIWLSPFDPLDRDDGQDEGAVCSYVWQDGGERLSVCIGNEYGDIKDFPGRLSVAAYDRAVTVINQGAPSGCDGEQVYKTEVHLENGRVSKVMDGFYDPSRWQYNQQNITWRERKL